MTSKLVRAGALLLALAATSPAAAKPKPPRTNALAAYVRKPDAAFGWTVAKRLRGPGWHGVVLDLTSQRWLTQKDSDRSLWKHWLTVIVPDVVQHRAGFLYITGGDNDGPAPEKPDAPFLQMALDTHSVVAELYDVPNQPVHFPDNPEKGRVEDDAIVHQQVAFLRDHDPEELLRLPMVKSGSAALTAVQQYLAREEKGQARADRFVVAGASKRGWTTWLLGAIDPRVEAIAPVVINVLNFDATVRHQWEAMGYFSPALKDYIGAGLIPKGIGSPGMAEINRLEDPFNYRDWPSMRMPKFIIHSAGDQFFPPDDTRFSYGRLPQTKRLRIMPNTDHSTAGSDIFDSLTAFYAAVLNHQSLPDYNWSLGKDGVLTVRPQGAPAVVKLWQATNPKARDFRQEAIGKVWTSTDLERRPDGSYRATLAKPEAGWAASFIELIYPGAAGHALKFTTEVFVTPDTLPYRWKDARPITTPQG